MAKSNSRLLTILFLGLASLCAKAQTITTHDTDLVVHALCRKQVALLGESPIHGLGETLDFKVQLVGRLIDECHYNAIFFESGTYDFIQLERERAAGHPATDAELSAAIGGLWANQEVQSLVPFLREKSNAGSLSLGGIDHQLNRDTWAQHEMPAYLAHYLDGEERTHCLAVLQRFTLWQYTDDAPYGPAENRKIVGCLDTISSHISSHNKTADEDRILVDNLKRTLARDYSQGPTSPDQQNDQINAREHSMYANFQWLDSRLPKHSKVIVWAASVHIAKDLSHVEGVESRRVPLGFFLHQRFGDRSFALGFSALAGQYASFHPPARALPDAPASSLEAQGFQASTADTLYLSRQQLAKLGLIAARPLNTTFASARWDEVFDGLVVFRKEHAPTWIKR